MRSRPSALALLSLLLPAAASAQTELHRLVPADNAGGDHFGTAVALAGASAIVGAAFENHGQKTDVGKVYVFDAASGAELAQWVPAPGSDGDRFGTGVAASAGRVLVTAPGDDDRATNAGALYVFDLASGQQLHKLTPSAGWQNAEFGAVVDVEDRFAVVGAPQAGPLTFEGSAYVFDVETGQELFELKPPIPHPGLGFGSRVAIGADFVAVAKGPHEVFVFELATGQLVHTLQGDGLYGYFLAFRGDELLVSANPTVGQSFVEVRDAATGALLSTIDAPLGFAGLDRGMAVDGDRLTAKTTNVAEQRTVVLVHDLASGEWLHQLREAEPYPYDAFGDFVAVEGDRVLVSAHEQWHDGMKDAGAAYLFEPLPLGASYCGPAVPNSTGLPGVIRSYGSPRVADGCVWVEAAQLPASTFGYFLVGATQGLVHQPGGSQGDLCLTGQVGRYTEHVFSSGAGGRTGLDLDLQGLPLPGGGHAVVAGETWNWTTWFRDKNPTTTSNFTDGISITFL